MESDSEAQQRSAERNQELEQREREIRQREVELKLREMEAEINPPVYKTVKHQPEKLSQPLLKNIMLGAALVHYGVNKHTIPNGAKDISLFF
ncbi:MULTISPECIES: hypothetical protein [unclassified Tolypothrix]|uniref:hypothetical protein n=1 Tax=unclassified Tolypothrix TaxID=2649714 RepID=UPI0005EAAE57|nr:MULTISPECIES: hypothetical protein [unclassified Tolypothrix]BAY88772.1 hypothetical protein NIES3275_07720 [Microchaete diplosiphon NIES-3275]EKF01666.1 hypothetical protein FDUTEX481_07823 [Tolypothrix sp. PCC 7601]MBE9086465.1 hypothetical protein [Tolypothrix sp. LEGE 11397]UYD29432.1 hypothetical protein HGR01_16240 [Tolypothrix sp. PCC 7712]UYD34659.1 hypothetical protein HG267_02075 [Tolypothrix sp. PCC 7601]